MVAGDNKNSKNNCTVRQGESILRALPRLVFLSLVGLCWMFAEETVAFSNRGSGGGSSYSYSYCHSYSYSCSSGYANRHHHCPTRKDLYRLGTKTNTNRSTKTPSPNRRRSASASLSMRDRSCSYWFTVGDTVEVVEDVWSGSGTARQNWKGRTGRVVETWEKCDVDPTCCCAEQVDTDMAVRVVFGEIIDNDGNDGNNGDNDDGDVNAHDEEEEEAVETVTMSTESNSPATDTTRPDGEDKSTKASTAYYYYFAEDELVKL